jgi:phosphate-selective porin
MRVACADPLMPINTMRAMEINMRTLSKLILASACAVITTAASFAATAADSAAIDGVLIYKHQQTVANTDMDPGATTVGQFFHDYPRGAPLRAPMVPKKEVVMLRVRKANGEHVEIMQDLDDSKNLSVGDKVLIEQVDGKDRVVPVQ